MSKFIKGEYAELTCCPDAIVRVHEDKGNDLYKVVLKGDNKPLVYGYELKPTTATKLALPEWLQVGTQVHNESTGVDLVINEVGRTYIKMDDGDTIHILNVLRNWEPVAEPVAEPEPQPQPTQQAQQPQPIPQPQMQQATPSNDMMSQAANLLFGSMMTNMQTDVFNKVMELVRPYLEKVPVQHVHTFNVCGNSYTSQAGEIFHPQFEKILFWLAQGKNVWIYGPAGTGKTHCAMQLAKVLGKAFYFCNRISDEYQLTGFVDANGVYNDTPYYHAFTSDALFLFDECDGSSETACLTLNSSLDNRMFDVPKFGNIKAHDGFVCIAAGNTNGLGPSEEYNGRAKLDAAFMQRFGAVVKFDYDPRIEQLQSGGDMDLLEFTRAARVASKNLNISDVIISYRNIDALRLAAHGGYYTDLHEAIEDTIWRGLDADTINNIKSTMKPMVGSSNKYFKKA